MEALVSRNNVAHAYNKEIALEIVRSTKAVYFKLFETLVTKLREEWICRFGFIYAFSSHQSASGWRGCKK